MASNPEEQEDTLVKSRAEVEEKPVENENQEKEENAP